MKVVIVPTMMLINEEGKNRLLSGPSVAGTMFKPEVSFSVRYFKRYSTWIALAFRKSEAGDLGRSVIFPQKYFNSSKTF